MGGGGLIVSPPTYEIFAKGYPPKIFWKKWHFEEKFHFFGQKLGFF
jgi:hypothetical protein